jgi:hypothetical protein
MSRRGSERLAALLGAFAGTLVVTAVAFAGFSSGSSATSSVQTKRIFLGARTAGTRTVSDVSSGAATSLNDALSYADGTVKTTGNWATTFSSTRYVQFNFNSPLPAGVAVSGATFDFRVLPNTSTDNVCYYLEVRRQSDNSLLATHYSSGSPNCVTGSTFSTNSVSLPEVTTSDIANDLYVKVFARDVTGARGTKIDMATLTLSLYSTTETLYEELYSDAADGSAANTTWQFDAADSTTYTNGSNWPTTYTTTKYLQFGFPVIVPTGSTISSVTFDRTWHSASTTQVCYYIAVYSGATLLGTHGSGSQISCSNSTSVWNVDHTPLSEVTSATDVNQLFIRVIAKATSGQKSVDDLDTVTVTYYLD